MKDEQFYAYFKDVVVLSGKSRIAGVGGGASKEVAIRSYAARISGKTILDSSKEDMSPIAVPLLTIGHKLSSAEQQIISRIDFIGQIYAQCRSNSFSEDQAFQFSSHVFDILSNRELCSAARPEVDGLPGS